MKTQDGEGVRESVTAMVNCSGANDSAPGLHDGLHLYVQGEEEEKKKRGGGEGGC